MEDKNKQVGDFSSSDASQQASYSAGLPADLSFDPQALSAEPNTVSSPNILVSEPGAANPRFATWLRRGAFVIAALVLVGSAAFLVVNAIKRDTGGLAGDNAAGRFETTTVPLDDIHVEPIVNLSSTKVVTINGKLTIKEGLVVAPTVQPANAEAGQIYYDINSNTLAYFNGTSFVSVGGDVVTDINTLTGNIPLGAGLADIGGQLVNTGVLSVQGLNGNVTLTAGQGIAINGTTIANDGVISVVSSSPALTVTDDGNGNLTLDLSASSGTGTVTSTGGNVGRIAKFTAAQNIEDSLLSESGATITVNGNLAVTGSVTLSTPLSVSNGGTGAASLNANGILVGNGTSAFTSIVAGGAGFCLVSTAGAPVWGNCNPPSTTVNSVNGLSGALTIANATGLVDTITIDDASTSNKGIVQFNGTNFSVSNGVANTIQNISTTSSPTFSSLTLTGDIAVNGGDITSTGALNVTPAGALTAGSATQALTLQGNSSTVFTATNGANTTTVSFQAPTANVTYRFATAAVGSYDICTTAGNCGGGGSITGSGTAGTIPVFSGATAIGDSLVSQSGVTVTINGHLSLAVGNQFQINGTQISSANLSNDSNLAKLNASQTFTGNNVAFQNGSNSATAFAVQNALGNRIATVDTTGGELELGQGSTIGGRLVFNNATNNNTVTLVSAVVTGNRTITLPDDSGTVCLSSGNCAGAGATLQTSYNNSTNPEIVLDATRGALTLRDNSTPLGANLFEIQDNAGTTTYFAVTATGVSVTGTATATGNINSSGGALQTNGTTRVDNSGNLTNIGSISLSGGISGGTTFSGSGNINTTGGALQTNTTTRVDISGNLTNIGNLTATGAITIASTGAGNDIIIDGADQFIVQDAGAFNGTATFNTDVDFTLADAENVALTNTATGTNAVNLLQSVLTNNTTSGTQQIALLQNAAGSGATEALLALDNADSDTAVASGLIVTSAAGGVATALDVSDSDIVTALSFGANDIAGTNFSVTGASGNVLSAGNATLQGGVATLGTTSQAGSLVISDGSSNTGTLQVAALGADRTYTFPDSTGTVCLTTGNCAGSGSGVTSSSGGTANRLAKFTSAQNIENSTITDDGTTVTTTVDLVIQGGDATIGVASSQTGTLNFAHSGSGNLGSIVQGALTGGRTYTLPDTSGTFCLSSGNCSGPGSSNTLQAAYDAGNIITTTTGRDIDVVLADTGTDSNFDIVVADGSTSFVSIARADGAGISDPAQLLLIDNLDANRAVAVGVKLQAAAGGLTTGIDASDAEIGDAINVGANNIVGTTGNIDLSNFDVTGSNGNVTAGTYNGQTISNTANFTGTLAVTGNTTLTGDIAVNGGDITSTGTLTVTPGGALTLGDTGQTTLLRGSTTTITSTGVGNDITLNSTDTIELQDNTNVTGNLDVSGTLAVGTADALQVAANGNLVSVGNATWQGGTVTVGTNSQAGSIVLFDGTSNAGTLLLAALGQDTAYTLPDPGGASASICLSTGNCLGPGGSGANTALSNLASVAINTTLLPGVAGAINLGSGTLPIGDIFLAGSSGTPGTNNFRITGASTSGTRTITLPDASGTVCINTNNCSYAPSSGSTNYIQNQIASPQTSANFSIDGEGRAATFNATTGINTGAGAGTQRIDSSGNLVSIGSLSLSGAISGGTTYSGSGNINSTGGAIQTNSTNRIDNTGNLVNIGDITATGATTIASTGAGNDITINGADQFIVQDTAVFNTDVDFALADTENINITSTVTGTNAVNLINTVLTNNTASGTQQIALLQNAAGTGGTESLLALDNADSDTAVASGLIVTSAAGAVTNALDVSDSDIVTALLFGANDIDGTSFDVDGATGNVTAGTYNSQTISNAANFTGTLTVANNLTLTAGDIAVNGGDITSSGALNITPGGTLTVGATAQTLTLQGGAGTTFRSTNGANTTTVGFTAATANTTLNFPALSAGTYDICTSSGNCAGAGVTLQVAYNNSTNPELVLGAAATAGITIRDNSTPIAGNLFEIQNNGASTTFFAVTSSGIQTTGTETASGNINTTGGDLQTGSASRIDNTGNLVNIGNLTASGAITIASTNATNDIILNSADTIELQDATNVTGTLSTTSTITLGALGTTDTSAYLCRNSSNLLAACNTTGAGAAFVQGGNSFGATAVLGTNENFGLDIRTNSTTRMSIGAGGGVLIQGNATADELEVGDDIFNLNDANARINLGSSANDSYIRMGESSLAFGFVGWQNSINAMRLSTFGSNDVRLETNSTTRITVSGAGVTTIAGTGSSGVAGFSVDSTQNTTTGLQPGNILTTTFNPGGSASASYFGNQMLANVGSTGTTFTGDIIANLGQVNWSGATNTSNTGKLYGTVGKVVTASGAGSVQNAVALFSQLQYAVGTTVTNSYNVYASNLQSGATTNLYGFYAEQMTGGTNNYPLYLASATQGQPLLSVNGTGATALRNSTDSASAFQIQNASGVSGLNVDTTTANLLTNHSFETDTSGWVASGAATLSRVTTQYYDNTASLQAATTAASGDGARHAYSLASSTQYTFSVFVKASVGGFNAVEIGRSEDGSTDTSCATNIQAFSTHFARYSCTFTTGTVSGSPYLYIKQIDTNARNMWIDAVQLETAASATLYRNSKVTLAGSLAINSGTSPVGNTDVALRVTAPSGGDGVHITGSGSGSVFKNILLVTEADGSTLMSINDASRGTTIQGGHSFFGNSALTAISVDAGVAAFEAQGASGQTADIFKVQNSSDVNMFTVGATGAVLSKNTTDSTTAFQVQNASAQSLLNVDTTNRSTSVSSVAAASLFSLKVDYTTATSPFGTASADLDKDGDIDLVVVNNGSASISVFLNSGSGTFAAKVDYTTATNPRNVTAADFDKDGDIDLAVTNSGSASFSVFMNNGSGAFAAKVDYTTATSPFGITAADFDKDGDIDVAAVNNGSTSVSIFLNTGSGTFAAKVDYTTASTPRTVTAADFDKDGDIDLVVTNSGSTSLSILMNNGSGTFAAKVDYSTGSSPNGIVSGDFDKDGDMDLAVSNDGSSTVSVLLNTGTGTFATKVDYTTGSTSRALATADIDKDGDLDLVTSNEGPDSASVLLNNGNGTFAYKVDFATGTNPNGVTIADFDKDGDMDIATANNGTTTVSVLLNATLAVSPISTPTLSLYSGGVNDALQVKTADDKRLLVVDARGNLLLGDQSSGTNMFESRVGYTSGEIPLGIASADFDKDGDIDLVTSSWNDNFLAVYLNKGDGTYAPKVDYANGTGFGRSIVTADFDGDGDIDIAVANEAPDLVAIFLNNGSGTFASAVTYSVGADPIKLAAGDFNKDGDIDLAVATWGTSSVSILSNNGSGVFSNTTYATSTPPTSVATADLDKDGDLDLALTLSGGGDSVSVRLNSGTGTFPSGTDYASNSLPRAITTADFDKDGDIDVASTAIGNETVSVYMNNGSGVLAAKVDYSTGADPYNMLAADLDKDGDVDIVTGNDGDSNAGMSVLLGSGTGTFATKVDYPGISYDLTTADLDKDGDLDIAAADDWFNQMTVRMNNTLSDSRFKILSGDGDSTLFKVNATGVHIGSEDSTGALLVLDTKNTINDPIGTNGAMYYNSAYGRFRCYQNDVWVDCISGSAREYLKAELTTEQTTNITSGDHIKFNTRHASAGGGISVDTSTSYVTTAGAASIGRFTLAAGKTYRLNAAVPFAAFSGDGAVDYTWYNATTSTAIGNAGGLYSATGAGAQSRSSYAEAIITPSTTTLVEVRLTNVSALSRVGEDSESLNPTAYIEVLSDGGAGGASASEYLRAQLATDQTTNVSDNDHIKFEQIQASSGSSIALDTTTAYTSGGGASVGRFTLAAGKTYMLRGQIPRIVFGTANASVQYRWYNVTAGTGLGTSGASVSASWTSSNIANDPYAETIITPSVTTVVELRLLGVNGGLTTIGGGGGGDARQPSAFIEVLSDGTKIAQFQGATASVDGQSGYVPMPSAGQQGSLLVGDGAWSSGLTFLNTGADRGLQIDSTEDSFIFLNGDSDNDGSEVGTAFIELSQDNSTSHRYLGTIQTAGQDPKGGTYTGTTANATLLGNVGTDVLQFGTDAVVRLTIATNGQISMGTSDTTGALFVLDSKSGSGNTGVTSSTEGGMYYNTTDDKFRCYQQSEWRDCVSSVVSNGIGGGSAFPSGTSASTTYVNVPGGASALSFTKKSANTKLTFQLNMSFYVTVANKASFLAINLDGTDYECMVFWFNQTSVHHNLSCNRVITGITAGAKTAQVRWKVDSGGSMTGDSGDRLSLTVLETD